jgi:predicted dehydrogenase
MSAPPELLYDPRMLRIGLLGAGSHALTHHAPALRHCVDDPEFAGRVELLGVCDADAARARALAGQFSFGGVYDSVDALVAAVDAVVSVLPAAALAASLEPILRHDRPVAIEKPLGSNLADTDRIARLLTGRPHMVSLNRRFDPAVRLARDWIQGRPPLRAIHGLMARHNRLEPDFVWSTGIHLADLMCFLAGPLRLLSGSTTTGGGAGRVGVLSGEGGVRGTVQFLPACGRVEEAVQLTGDGWFAEVATGTRHPWRVRCWSAGPIEVDAAAEADAPEFLRSGTRDETAAFLRALLGGQSLPGPTVDDARPGTELTAALQRLAPASGQ